MLPDPSLYEAAASADVTRGVEFVSGLPGLPTRARTRGVIFFTRPGPGSGGREGTIIAHQAVNAAIVQPMNHTYVVSVEDLEALISEARHLASEEDAGTVHADLGGNLARTTGSGGEAT